MKDSTKYSVYIPCGQSDESTMSAVALMAVMSTAAVAEFGGVTVVKGTGGYLHKDGTPEFEPVGILSVIVPDEEDRTDQAERFFRDVAQAVKEVLGQESVLLTREGIGSEFV